MIGLDTNVVIRYLVQDDAAQARKANQLLESLTPDSPGFINLTALCEIAWVLKRNYRLSKSALVEIIEGLLTTKQIVVEDVAAAWKALRAYEANSADFSDAVINYANLAYGCDQTVTFDKQAAKLEGMRLL